MGAEGRAAPAAGARSGLGPLGVDAGRHLPGRGRQQRTPPAKSVRRPCCARLMGDAVVDVGARRDQWLGALLVAVVVLVLVAAVMLTAGIGRRGCVPGGPPPPAPPPDWRYEPDPEWRCPPGDDATTGTGTEP